MTLLQLPCPAWARTVFPRARVRSSDPSWAGPAGALLGLFLALAACADGGRGLGRSASPVSPGFTTGDLAGDWVGLLAPVSPGQNSFNFYARFDVAGLPYEAADGWGNEWLAGSFTGTSQVNSTGALAVTLAQTGGDLMTLQLQGQLNEARNSVDGTYVLLKDATVASRGSYSAVLTSGAGHFTVAEHLAGTWAGAASRWPGGREKDLNLVLDAAGTVQGGNLGPHVFIVGGPNTGIFFFSNDAVGRLDNVVVQSEDGSVQIGRYLLVDDLGSVITGPGSDSVMGPGVGRLAKQ